jgi:hypothetical protein
LIEKIAKDNSWMELAREAKAVGAHVAFCDHKATTAKLLLKCFEEERCRQHSGAREIGQ